MHPVPNALIGHGWYDAFHSPSQECILALIAAGADVEARGGHEACVRLLLKNGASATIKDNAGKTLYESLKEWDGAKDLALMRLLQAHGMRK